MSYSNIVGINVLYHTHYSPNNLSNFILKQISTYMHAACIYINEDFFQIKTTTMAKNRNPHGEELLPH